jgi:hypothetical protein
MPLEDLVLSLQRVIDRFLRRLRRGGAPEVTRRRFLIVQIDGLSRVVLDKGLASGHMPFLKRLLRRRGYRVEPMTVGLPTSTPAFQMAAMYDVRPDIPGFHYYDRERQTDIHFPRAGHAALVEAKHVAGRRGILQGGSAYGCVFTGGADNNLFTFASLTRPSGRGLLAALSPFVVLGWVCLKSLTRTVIELIKAIPLLVAPPLSGPQERRWLTIKIGISIWVRGFFTMAVSRDLYAGVPAVYVNYLDYDETAHAFGPQSRRAFVSLRRVDRAIRQLWRVVRRVPEHQYDLYILSDHGQASCRPYRDVNGGQRFERWIFNQFLDPKQTVAPYERSQFGLAHGIRSRSRGAAGLFQQFFNYIDADFLRCSDPEAHEQDGVRVIAAGPNAFLYVLETAAPLDAEILESRFPGLGENLSRRPWRGLRAGTVQQRARVLFPGQAVPLSRVWARAVRESRGRLARHSRHRRSDDDAERRRPRDLWYRCSRWPRFVHSRDGRSRRAVARRDAHVHRAPRESDAAVAHQSPGAALRSLHPLSGGVMRSFIVAGYEIGERHIANAMK